MSVTNAPMTWFEKTTMMSQSIITFPVLGPITGYQAVIIFGLGLLIMFGVIQSTNSIAYAVAPFLCIVAFAMIRPPLISYESRLASNLQFMMFGPKTKKKKSKKARKKSDVLVMPDSDLAEDEIMETPVTPEAPMQVFVNPNTQIEVVLTLRTGYGLLRKTKVWVFIDNTRQKTTMSNSSGEVRLLLDSSECVGRKEIAIRDIKQDTEPGSIILSKAVEFVQK